MTTPIIGPFPANIAAGQDVAAAPVMANFDWIRSQVNANVVPTLTRSVVMVRCNGFNNMVSTAPMLVGINATVPTVVLDTLGEFSTLTGLFTAQRAGNYEISAQVMLLRNTATIVAFGPGPRVQLLKNSAACAELSLTCPNDSSPTYLVGYSSAIASLAIGDTLSATAAIAFTGGPVQFGLANMSIVGLG